jgi:hypothetical protein
MTMTHHDICTAIGYTPPELEEILSAYEFSDYDELPEQVILILDSYSKGAEE